MKFDKSLDWLKESDEDDNLLADDELDDAKGDEEQINEVRYIDPSNVDKYDPSEIEEVTTASGEKRYKRKSGTQSSNKTVDKKEKSTTKGHSNKFNVPKDVDTLEEQGYDYGLSLYDYNTNENGFESVTYEANNGAAGAIIDEEDDTLDCAYTPEGLLAEQGIYFKAKTFEEFLKFTSYIDKLEEQRRDFENDLASNIEEGNIPKEYHDILYKRIHFKEPEEYGKKETD